jgi:hypothetical protein
MARIVADRLVERSGFVVMKKRDGAAPTGDDVA